MIAQHAATQAVAVAGPFRLNSRDSLLYWVLYEKIVAVIHILTNVHLPCENISKKNIYAYHQFASEMPSLSFSVPIAVAFLSIKCQVFRGPTERVDRVPCLRLNTQNECGDINTHKERLETRCEHVLI